MEALAGGSGWRLLWEALVRGSCWRLLLEALVGGPIRCLDQESDI